jgi:nicotinate-nucleotide adenylyltransferase
MKDIAVFGGTFDPPTKAHEGIITACLEQPAIDEVWVMPSGQRPDKPHMSDNAARLAMLELVKADTFHDDSRLVVSDFEQQLPQPTETRWTVRALRQAYPGYRFWHVCGADVYHRMPTWEGGEELRRNLGMLVVERDGYELPAETLQIKQLQAPQVDAAASSTRLREVCQNGGSLEAMTSKAVMRYIATHALYRNVEQELVK